MITFLKSRNDESKILFFYRYLSLFITSGFYILNQYDHTINKKIFIIGCLTIAAIILSYLYLIFQDSEKAIKLLLLVEIVSNSLLLIPSGGLKSPFIWYTLNTVLISSLFLKKRYVFINIFLHILITFTITYFSSSFNINIFSSINEHSNLILSFLMIIASIQLLSIYIQHTKEKSRQLEIANKMNMESIDHIKALYQSVGIFSSQGNVEGLINILFEHIIKITKTKAVFYYDISHDNYKMIAKCDKYMINQIEEKILSSFKEILESKTSMEIAISHTRFIVMPVGTNYPYYGILGFEVTSEKEGFIYKNNIHQIKFLSELISIALERINLEELNDRLLVSEEQNRIANEIHDSVLQRLFSMSCGVFSLIKKLPDYNEEEIKVELNHFREITDEVMKELRTKIYGLSWKKSGQSSFIKDIKKYIEDIKRFSDVNIPFTIKGNIELLSCNQKKAFYRIISEGIGNAVRHGNARNVEVCLDIGSILTTLSIMDDGIGFDVERIYEDKTAGLGIQNMNQLTESLNGAIKIFSEKGKGTSIKVAVPNSMMYKEGGNEVYESTHC